MKLWLGLGRRSSSRSSRKANKPAKDRAAAEACARQREVALAKWERALFEENLALRWSPPGRMRAYTFSDCRQAAGDLDADDLEMEIEDDVELLPPCSAGFKRVQSDEVERRRIVQAMISWRLSTHQARTGPQREA